MSWIDKVKQRSNIHSGWQLVLILIVFACTGFSVLFIKKPLMNFLTGGDAHTWQASVIYYVVIMTPLYYVLLLTYGFIFGQFNFFWGFAKRTFGKIFKRKQQPVK